MSRTVAMAGAERLTLQVPDRTKRSSVRRQADAEPGRDAITVESYSVLDEPFQAGQCDSGEAGPNGGKAADIFKLAKAPKSQRRKLQNKVDSLPPVWEDEQVQPHDQDQDQDQDQTQARTQMPDGREESVAQHVMATPVCEMNPQAVDLASSDSGLEQVRRAGSAAKRATSIKQSAAFLVEERPNHADDSEEIKLVSRQNFGRDEDTKEYRDKAKRMRSADTRKLSVPAEPRAAAATVFRKDAGPRKTRKQLKPSAVGQSVDSPFRSVSASLAGSPGDQQHAPLSGMAQRSLALGRSGNLALAPARSLGNTLAKPTAITKDTEAWKKEPNSALGSIKQKNPSRVLKSSPNDVGDQNPGTTASSTAQPEKDMRTLFERRCVNALKNLPYVLNLAALDLTDIEICELEVWITTEIPEEFRSRVRIQVWDQNCLTTVPELVRLFPNTDALHMRANKLVQLPAWLFCELPSLRRLYLESNRIGKLPRLDSQSGLEHINLDDNKLLEVPQDWLESFPCVCSLFLGKNGLKRCCVRLRHAPKLVILMLDNNEISELEALPEDMDTFLEARAKACKLFGNPVCRALPPQTQSKARKNKPLGVEYARRLLRKLREMAEDVVTHVAYTRPPSRSSTRKRKQVLEAKSLVHEVYVQDRGSAREEDVLSDSTAGLVKLNQDGNETEEEIVLESKMASNCKRPAGKEDKAAQKTAQNSVRVELALSASHGESAQEHGSSESDQFRRRSGLKEPYPDHDHGGLDRADDEECSGHVSDD
ncbi:MAP kinase phosphatase with leucine-rich repeats protein 1 [Porphyridium purpureum]|uniref:MAP kinase phosphatase with leucine-rich repeats protein 1 n=1 Tax=Porphyridium purpureum TaxID=35688 RepID=A0A5J4YYF5_PORPP|nr:MAP kinase phosphatase with leucine-rich repeats protein 1 [Porphyridium purpureum]|eukprot:POR5034..scf208_2